MVVVVVMRWQTTQSVCAHSYAHWAHCSVLMMVALVHEVLLLLLLLFVVP
jgi:hypothetical protein